MTPERSTTMQGPNPGERMELELATRLGSGGDIDLQCDGILALVQYLALLIRTHGIVGYGPGWSN